MTRYLVTGGAGFIGSHIVRKLIASGETDIVIYDDLSVGSIDNVPEPDSYKGVFVKGDIRNYEQLNAAMQGVDVVLHNAAFVSIRGSFDKMREELSTNCLGTLNVLESAGTCGIRKVIFASSMAVYGQPNYLPVDEVHPTNPISPYGMSKLRGEMYLKILSEEYGYDAVTLRYFNTYGSGQTLSNYVGVTTIFINYMLDHEPITMLGDPEKTRDFVWVEDVADANVYAAMNNVTGTFNIGSGKETSIGEIAGRVMEAFGRDPREEMIRKPAPKGEIGNVCADIRQARKYLNYNPKGNLSKAIPEIVAWWKEKNKGEVDYPWN
jgi:UDP-glucose 4-epimerase